RCYLSPVLYTLSFQCSGPHRDVPSFPTRRSSDLGGDAREVIPRVAKRKAAVPQPVLMTALETLAGIAKQQGARRHQLQFHRNFRSEEHTSELQSRGHLVCRLLLEKKNKVTEHRLD